MNVHTEQSGGVAIVRVGDARLMYPMLGDFSAAVNSLVASGKRDILIDLTPVTYVDSAGLAMRIIKTTTGVAITLDGDLLAIMETLYREVTASRGLERSFEDMVKEIHHLIDQMDDGERKTYLAESLFVNTVKYENDKLEAYMRKLTKK